MEVASATRANGLEFRLTNSCLLRWYTIAFPKRQSASTRRLDRGPVVPFISLHNRFHLRLANPKSLQHRLERVRRGSQMPAFHGSWVQAYRLRHVNKLPIVGVAPSFEGVFALMLLLQVQLFMRHSLQDGVFGAAWMGISDVKGYLIFQANRVEAQVIGSIGSDTQVF